MGLLMFEDRADATPAVPPHHLRPFPGHSSDFNPLLSFGPTPAAASSCAPEQPPRHVPRLSDLSANPPRKRSHDDFTTTTTSSSADSEKNETDRPIVPPCIEEQPIYGEGMTLLNPRSGLAVSAESQTGTWFEEQMEADTTTAPPLAVSTDSATNHSHHRGRKSQRLDASAAGFDDITASAIQRKLNNQASSSEADIYRTPALTSASGSPSTSTFSSSSPGEPRVDDLTLLLGISWQRVSGVDQDMDMGPAVRGWEKYIGKHYAGYLQAPPRIVLKHRGLNAYLVTSSSETSPKNDNGPTMMSIDHPPPSCFYLFNEDLSEARLVANDWDTCIQRLRTTPITFAEGSEPIKPAATRPCEEEGMHHVGDGQEGPEAVGTMSMCADGFGGPDLGPEATMDIDP